MLRCNAKIWAVVVLICIVAQFFVVSLPAISESFSQMDAVFEQRVVEEKEKAAKLKSNENEWDTGAVADMSQMFYGGEKVEDMSYVFGDDEAEESEKMISAEKVETEEDESSGGSVFLMLFGFFVLMFFIAFVLS